MLNRSNLHPYQERAVQFIKDTKKCALYLDMGLGKTCSTLTALQDLKDSGDINHPVLIIAPLRVANTVWKQEADKWNHVNLSFSIVTGPVLNRKKALAADADIYVINRENVEWLVKQYGAAFPFKTVVVDESQSFKSPKSRRFKSLKKVNQLITRMIQLTGTPATNGLLDLWSQIYLLDRGATLGTAMSRFRNKYFTSDYMGFKWKINGGADKQIFKLLKPLTLSMQAEDYLNMPNRVDNIINLELSKKQMKMYSNMEKDFLLELEDEVITAVNSAVLAGKLLQLANGALYTEDGYTEIHSAKLDALAEIIDDTTQPILVAYNFKSDLVRLQERFPQGKTLDREGTLVEQWNKGTVPLMFCSPRSAGAGLNLQHGGSIITWYGLTYSLEDYLQFNARVFRQGQDKTVVINHLVSKGTIDEEILKILASKDATQTSLLVSLRDKIQKAA